MLHRRTPGALPLVACLAFAGTHCSQAKSSDDERERAAVQRAMKKFIGDELARWLDASRGIADSAPLPKDRGWDAALDRDAIAAMKGHWARGRAAYERI